MTSVAQIEVLPTMPKATNFSLFTLFFYAQTVCALKKSISDDGKRRAQSNHFEVAGTSWFFFSKIKLVAQIIKEFLPTLPKHLVGTT